MAKQYSKEFKEDAVKYFYEHPELGIVACAHNLGISKSAMTAWKKRLPSDSKLRKEELKRKIQKIYDDLKQNYGAPKITMILRQKGDNIAEKTVGSYMREMGIKAQWIKPFTVTTIDPDFGTRLKNILHQEFSPEEPNAVWCSDITYIWTYMGFVYLTSVMDLFSRKIIVWTLSTTLEAKWVTQTI